MKSQRGFALVALMIAIAIIAVIYFGAGRFKGEVKQKMEVKQKATEDLNRINDNLKNNNQAIEKELNDGIQTSEVVKLSGLLSFSDMLDAYCLDLDATSSASQNNVKSICFKISDTSLVEKQIGDQKAEGVNVVVQVKNILIEKIPTESGNSADLVSINKK